MPQFELVMPKMGESIIEATILNWVKNVGDVIEEDDTILEIATDKVDSEIPSPVAGTLTKILFEVDDVVPVGKVIALIETDQEVKATAIKSEASAPEAKAESVSDSEPNNSEKSKATTVVTVPQAIPSGKVQGTRFYSPLVRNIAKQNGIGIDQLEKIPGSGAKGRVTKHDILAYIDNPAMTASPIAKPNMSTSSNQSITVTPTHSMNGQDEIVEMDRMRRLISDHMTMSKKTSAHVTSFVEVDMTNIVTWRNRVKKGFKEKYQQNITYTPIFIEAVVKAIQDFPMVNVSVDGYKIIKKNRINIGMATAMKNGNLIVPVIKNADQQSLLGLTKQVNDLAFRARNNKLKADEVQDGTFTLTNVGTFGNVMGTPIINQPQVAIMSVGVIQKKPAVIETDKGDFVGIKNLMFISLSYDHRVVDGMLGGSFLKRCADYLEAFDMSQTI